MLDVRTLNGYPHVPWYTLNVGGLHPQGFEHMEFANEDIPIAIWYHNALEYARQHFHKVAWLTNFPHGPGRMYSIDGVSCTLEYDSVGGRGARIPTPASASDGTLAARAPLTFEKPVLDMVLVLLMWGWGFGRSPVGPCWGSGICIALGPSAR